MACEHCLAANDNPTAAINDQNQAFAADLNPPLHLTIVEMAELEVQFGQVCSVADEKGLSPESIDQQTKERLQNLSERCDHLAQVFKTGANLHCFLYLFHKWSEFGHHREVSPFPVR